MAEIDLDELIDADSHEYDDADIILYAGQIRRPFDHEVIHNVGKQRRRRNVLLRYSKALKKFGRKIGTKLPE